jgi:hypothetical protein
MSQEFLDPYERGKGVVFDAAVRESIIKFRSEPTVEIDGDHIVSVPRTLHQAIGNVLDKAGIEARQMFEIIAEESPTFFLGAAAIPPSEEIEDPDTYFRDLSITIIAFHILIQFPSVVIENDKRVKRLQELAYNASLQ